MLNQTAISCNSCLTWLLTSSFGTFFIYFLSVQKLQHLGYLANINLFWNLIFLKSFDWNETMSKYIQISILIRKHLWWRPFKYSSWYEGLQLYEKMTSSKIISCEIYEVYDDRG